MSEEITKHGAHKVKPNLGEPMPLAKRSRQSSGRLYDLFLSGHDRKVFKLHHYFDIYERHLSRYVDQAPRVLEIGLGDGGSPGLWMEWFGADATIVNIDIDPPGGRLPVDSPVFTETGDQADPAFLARVVEKHGPFDIVLDDGGHTARQQINSFNALYDALRDDGVFICEDTHTSYFDQYKDAGDDVSMVEYAKKLIDRLHQPYLGGAEFSRVNQPMEDREGHVMASRFAARTKGIFFYDSIIVFERQVRSEPWMERR
jgi:hypothetical protein